MRRFFLPLFFTLLALLLAATPGAAATYYASPTGSDANNGLSAGAPKTISAYLNAGVLAPGDLIYILPGTYTAAMANNGSGDFFTKVNGTPPSPITFIGDTVTATNVHFQGKWRFGYASGNKNITLKGIWTDGEIYLYGNTGGTGDATGIIVSKCRADSGFACGSMDSCRIEYNQFGNGGAYNYFTIGADHIQSRGNRIVGNTIYLGASSSATGNYGSLRGLDSTRVLSNRIISRHWPSGSTSIAANILFSCSNNLFLDNHWTFRNDRAAFNLYGLNMRDSCRFNLFARDTLETDTLSVGAVKFEFNTSGTYVGSTGYNTFTNCVFRPSGPIGYQVGGTASTGNADRHTFNQYITVYPFDFPSGSGSYMDSTVFLHNTFLTTNSNMWNSDAGDTTTFPVTNLRVGHNIFFSTSSNAGTLMEWKWNALGGERDSNLYYKANNDSAARFDYAYASKDARSKWANPVFRNTRWETADLTPSPTGLAKSSNLWADGYVGAIDPGGAVALGFATAATLDDQVEDVPFIIEFEPEGGTAPYTFLAIGGNVDIALDYDAPGFASSGLLDGVGHTPIAVSAIMQVTDAFGDTASKAFTFSVTSATPAAPVIEARYMKNLGAVGVVLTTETGFTTYDLRYRPDMSLAAGNWNNLGYVGAYPTRLVHTYRWASSETPPAGGTLDTILVVGLPPGVYTFGLVACADPTVISNIDSVTIPAPTDLRSFPQVGLYGGAGIPSSSGFKVWQPFVNLGRTALVTAEIDTAAQYNVVSLNSEAVDSVTIEGTGVNAPYLSILAMQRMRAINPTIKLLAEPTPENVYIERPSGRYTSADTANTYNSNWQMWRAVRDGGGGWGNVGGLHRGYASGSYTDSSGCRGILWKLQPAYKNYVWSADTASAGSGYASAIRNVNLAYKNAAGTYVVADSLVAVLTRHFISRTDPSGAWLWDGLMMDLMNATLWGATGQYAIDYARASSGAGYASAAALDTAWRQAHLYFVRSLRRNAILAGRPNFILTGNTTAGTELAVMNGGMTESWPSLGGGSWLSNYMVAREAQFREAANGTRNQWIFRYAASADSLGASVYNQTHYAAVRYGLGSACLTGATFVYEPSYAGFAVGGHVANPTQGFHRWWFDEYRVHTGTGASSLGVASSWLSQPTDIARQDSTRVIMASRDSTGSGGAPVAGANWLGSGAWWSGDFETAADTSWWFRENQAAVHGISSVGRVTDTTFAGVGAMKLQTQTATGNSVGVGYHSVSGKSIAAGRAVIIDFYGRANTRLPVQVGVSSATNGPNILRTGTLVPVVWLDTTWTRHQILGTTTAAGTQIGVGFWLGDTVGTVWIDNVMATVDSTTVGVFRRPFTNGVVLVNPSAAGVHYTVTAADIVAGKTLALVTGISGRPSSVNAGTALVAGNKVYIPATDAIFLVRRLSIATRFRRWMLRFIRPIL